MKAYAPRIGAVLYIVWGLVHIVGGAELLRQLSVAGVTGVLASVGTAVPASELPVISGGVTAAVLAFFAFNWVWIGLLVVGVGVTLNWHNHHVGYWLNLIIAGAADLGLIATLLVPGYMALADGWPGPLLWVLAAAFSTVGLLIRPSSRIEQVAAA